MELVTDKEYNMEKFSFKIKIQMNYLIEEKRYTGCYADEMNFFVVDRISKSSPIGLLLHVKNEFINVFLSSLIYSLTPLGAEDHAFILGSYYSFRRFISSLGGKPNIREYSRLNCVGLS